jgi:hypothetical protein
MPLQREARVPRTVFKTLWIGEPLASLASLIGVEENIDAWKTLRDSGEGC